MYGVEALRSDWTHAAGAGCGVSPATSASGRCAAGSAAPDAVAVPRPDCGQEAGLAAMLQALQQSLGGGTALGGGLRAHLGALLGALAAGGCRTDRQQRPGGGEACRERAGALLTYGAPVIA